MSSFAPTSSGQSSTSDAAKFDAPGAEFFAGMYDELQNLHNALNVERCYHIFQGCPAY
jgi:hypothetical protein